MPGTTHGSAVVTLRAEGLASEGASCRLDSARPRSGRRRSAPGGGWRWFLALRSGDMLRKRWLPAPALRCVRSRLPGDSVREARIVAEGDLDALPRGTLAVCQRCSGLARSAIRSQILVAMPRQILRQ